MRKTIENIKNICLGQIFIVESKWLIAKLSLSLSTYMQLICWKKKEYYNRAYNSQQASPFSDGDNQ